MPSFLDAFFFSFLSFLFFDDFETESELFDDLDESLDDFEDDLDDDADEESEELDEFEDYDELLCLLKEDESEDGDLALRFFFLCLSFFFFLSLLLSCLLALTLWILLAIGALLACP